MTRQTHSKHQQENTSIKIKKKYFYDYIFFAYIVWKTELLRNDEGQHELPLQGHTCATDLR